MINESRGVSVGRVDFSPELLAINQACLPSPGVHKHEHNIGFFLAGVSLSLGEEESQIGIQYIINTSLMSLSVYSYFTVA